MNISPEVQQKLDALSGKYEKIGQTLETQLEGMFHAKPLNYWDYIQTDALLNLQTQRTLLPDEMVFIMYHQINELLFKMILWELRQVAEQNAIEPHFFKSKLGRISRYFDMLTTSFTIMHDGMELEQYLKFRTTLSPASGFQSAQYRQIEFASTDLFNLIDDRYKNDFKELQQENLKVEDAFYNKAFDHLYWQAAGKNYSTGNKTYTLRDFELKYKENLLRFIKKYKGLNLYAKFKTLPAAVQEETGLINAMRHYDYTVNITWVMAHYNTAKHYLNRGEDALEATGGSAWVKYMHPRYQKRIFFPDLWSAEEIKNWGENNQ